MNLLEKTLKPFTDNRGILVELFVDELKEGQINFISINPNQQRGNHYHKNLFEIFVLLNSCDVEMDLDKIGKYKMKPFVEYTITPGIKHKFTNRDNHVALILVYMNRKFNPEESDIYF